MNYDDGGQHLYHSFRNDKEAKIEVKCCHCEYGKIIILDSDLEKPETVKLLKTLKVIQ